MNQFMTWAHQFWWRNNLVVGSPGPRQASRQHCHARGRVIESIHVIFMLFIHFILFMFLWPVRGRARPRLPNVKISCQGSTRIWFMYYHTILSTLIPTNTRPPNKMSVYFPEFQLSYHVTISSLIQTNSLPSDHKKSVRYPGIFRFSNVSHSLPSLNVVKQWKVQ